jgi:hypothetical protein
MAKRQAKNTETTACRGQKDAGSGKNGLKLDW